MLAPCILLHHFRVEVGRRWLSALAGFTPPQPQHAAASVAYFVTAGNKRYVSCHSLRIATTHILPRTSRMSALIGPHRVVQVEC